MRVNHYNPSVQLHSSAPTRLDLAGGTLDIWPLYLFHEGAQTLNAAITLRARCTLSSNDAAGLRVVSEDTGLSLTVNHWSELTGEEEPRLVTHILRFFRADRLTVITNSDSPLGAGLAGSSALNIALCGALANWQQCSYSSEELINLARNLEAHVLGVPTGEQDYRPAMYGGLATLTLGPHGARRETLSLDPHELQRRIVLVYSGETRNSGINNWDIMKRHLDGDTNVVAIFRELRDVAVTMRVALENLDWKEVGRQLQADWNLRKRLSPAVSTPRIDQLIEQGLNRGAVAAKVCGAGGGGCVLFLSEPSTTGALKQSLGDAGERVLDVKLDSVGLQLSQEQPSD